MCMLYDNLIMGKFTICMLYDNLIMGKFTLHQTESRQYAFSTYTTVQQLEKCLKTGEMSKNWRNV